MQGDFGDEDIAQLQGEAVADGEPSSCKHNKFS
jgi:hypothetical protein